MVAQMELKDVKAFAELGWQYINTGGGTMCWVLECKPKNRYYAIGDACGIGADVMTAKGDQLYSLDLRDIATAVAWAKDMTPKKRKKAEPDPAPSAPRPPVALADEVETIPLDPVTNEELERHGGFTMRLSSVGNPDHGQYAPVSNPVTVKGLTLKEMRKKADAYQRKWELGGGNWPNPEVKIGKRIVGHFSYNLRFWEGDGKPRPVTEKKREIIIDE